MLTNSIIQPIRLSVCTSDVSSLSVPGTCSGNVFREHWKPGSDHVFLFLFPVPVRIPPPQYFLPLDCNAKNQNKKISLVNSRPQCQIAAQEAEEEENWVSSELWQLGVRRRKFQWKEDKMCVCACVCVCVCVLWYISIFKSAGCTVCVCVCVCVRVCVCPCYLKCVRLAMQTAQIVLCVCVCVCVCVSASVCVCVCVCLYYLDSYIWFSCVSTQSHNVVKGTSQSSTDEMRTVIRTTGIPLAKDSKLIWCKM